ncbi:MAG: manganese-binding transcriptional regulator MntR [Deltaproteobacteria bacterium]|nr:manganese-binding transcriptional regulator MntR [Deltaproteobacteria bacterium]
MKPSNPRTRPKKSAAVPASGPACYRRTRSDHVSETAEDYVEMIAELIETEGEARPTAIATRFGVSHVTAVKAVARLAKAGLVVTKPYRSIFLTEEGKQLAAKCRARHHTVYEFLVALGVSKKAAELDAEGIEHHVSQETLAVFRRFLSNR